MERHLTNSADRKYSTVQVSGWSFGHTCKYEWLPARRRNQEHSVFVAHVPDQRDPPSIRRPGRAEIPAHILCELDWIARTNQLYVNGEILAILATRAEGNPRSVR